MIRLIIIFLLCFVPFANAEQKYIWTDENGQTRVSETEPENWGTQEFKETKESKQIEILRVREETIGEDQLKAAEERKRKLQTKELPAKRKKG